MGRCGSPSLRKKILKDKRSIKKDLDFFNLKKSNLQNSKGSFAFTNTEEMAKLAKEASEEDFKDFAKITFQDSLNSVDFVYKYAGRTLIRIFSITAIKSLGCC
jgi:hypothetical protein